MKQLTCEMCGSTDLIKQEGVFVCQSCGCKYSVEEAKKMMIEGTVDVRGTVKVDNSNELNSLLKRVFMFLEEGDRASANKYCEKILDIDPENALAYVGMLMSDLDVKKQEDLKNYIRPFDDNKNYQKAVKFADETLKKTLLGYVEHIKTNPTATKINDSAFEGRYDLTCYDIPDSVTEIGKSAFKQCGNLTHITFGKNVRKIGAQAFMHCSSLTSVIIPNSVTVIGDDAFCGCTNLTSITIGNSVTTIGSSAFQNCQKLSSVTIPCSVSVIDSFAFKRCYALSRISIPYNVSKIETGAFDDTVAIHIDYGNPYFEIKEMDVTTKRGLYDKRNGRLILLCSSDSGTPYGSNSYDSSTNTSKSGCYVATCVYGSYDCPQVWTLRRFRDYTLAGTWYGRAFIYTYYAISPTAVKWFGKTKWFKGLWKGTLDKMVADLQSKGVESTPYNDTNW